MASAMRCPADDLRRNRQPVSTNFAENVLPTATELPRIELISHVSPSPLNPLGVKGVGECGVIPAAAAIMSAIEHALDASAFGSPRRRSARRGLSNW